MGIEKLGLPAKPAAKGSTWVLDASSCQTCQTPFTLFNRKHHCRRCGGLFCANCSNSKVNLRGQGDEKLRVCDPCKTLEEAARFQARHRGKQQKGLSKGSSVAEDDALVREVLGDGMDSLLSGEGGEGDGHHGLAEESPSKDKAIGSKEEITSPEKLRDQAVEQKKIYATLKREGKNAEALQAFKRHKELSREADALELSLKKLAVSQRRALAEGIASTGGLLQKTNKESPENDKKKDQGGQSTEQEKAFSRHFLAEKKSSNNDTDEDLLSALKDLGWKEADLSEKKVKKGPTSDMDLLAEISDSLPKEETSKKKPAKQNPTQLEILAHKRRALALKREGKPAEAKEELKKAKLLEKKLEEMTLLEEEDEDEDDDDELAALMRSLNKEAKIGTEKGSSFPPTGGDIPLSFNFADDDDDTNVDVTDDDINDPSMIAALRSMGWEEEAATMEQRREPQRAGPESFLIAESVTKESSLQSEILTHKRRALALKREGNLAEAKIELQEAKVLEQKLEVLKSEPISSQPISTTATAASGKMSRGLKRTEAVKLEDVLEDIDDGVEVDEDDLRDPEMMAALKAMGFEEEEEEEILPPLQTIVKPSPRDKKNLQDEILSIKRSALALKKQGKTLEAREELRQAKVLEQKLQKMQQDLEASGLSPVATMAKTSRRQAQIPIPLPVAGFVSEDEEEEVEVSADDFMDPELVAALKSVGWQEEDTFVKDKKPEEEENTAAPSGRPPVPIQPYKAVTLPPKQHARKLQLQKELLAHKRRALALKREGKEEESELELKQGKRLEKEMEEIDNAALGVGEDLPEKSGSKSKQSIPQPTASGGESEEDEDVTDDDLHNPELLNALKEFGWKPEPQKTSVGTHKNPPPAPSKAENPGPADKVQNTGRKLDVANPPYTRADAETSVDPIWHAIMKSASINHDQVSNMVIEREDPSVGEVSFEREHGEIGSSTDLIPPLFDHPSVPDPQRTVTGKAPSYDLLSGGVWDASAENVHENDDSEEEDDVFDSGLLAALQSIGMRPSSSVQVRGDVANVKRRVDDQQTQEVGSVESRGQYTDSRIDNSCGAESCAVGRSPAPPGPDKAVSSDHDVPFVVKEAAGPSSNNHAPAAGVTTPSLQEQIKMHKRYALALKRDGKVMEARDELRQAKILEKQLETSTQLSTEERPSPENVRKTSGTLSATSPEEKGQTVSLGNLQASPSHPQTHKEQVRQELRQGKDRKKLQQESLAHKRKALGLRREGKTDEADAEFELAKTLEKQMEDLDRQSGKAVAQEEMGMVEDLLDPQLMAALKGLGFNDRDLHGGANGNMGPASLNKSSQQPNPQERKLSTLGQPNPSSTNAPERSTGEINKKSQSREGTSTPPVSYTVKEDRSANRNNQPAQSTEGRSTAGGTVAPKKLEERSGVQRGSQRVDSVADGGRSSKGGAGSSPASVPQQERQNLEEKIKREKIKAVELKRAGRQGEALEILRGAKRLEKELLAMAS